MKPSLGISAAELTFTKRLPNDGHADPQARLINCGARPRTIPEFFLRCDLAGRKFKPSLCPMISPPFARFAEPERSSVRGFAWPKSDRVS